MSDPAEDAALRAWDAAGLDGPRLPMPRSVRIAAREALRPLREWYERWVQPMADTGAASLLALKRAAETGESVMSEPVDQIRTVRLAFELRIEASAQRTFEVMTQQSLDWFPVTYGQDRVRRVVLEPRVGGQHYEDWGDGRGHLYGEVTVYDPPLRWATRGRVMPGTILDTDYRLREEKGAVVVTVTKVATGHRPYAPARSSP